MSEIEIDRLKIAQEIFLLWGSGGFHNENRDSNFEKYISNDCIIDYRLNTSITELQPYDGIFVGKNGFFQNMVIHTLFDWSDLKFEILLGPENSTFIYMDCLPVRKANGKAASGRCKCIIQSYYNEQGKITRSFYYFIGVPEWQAMYP